MDAEDGDEIVPLFSSSSDVCESLISRYGKSSAPQHRHLIATAAAMRSILQDESLPLSPPAYFAAAISSIQNTANDQLSEPSTLDVLASFMSVLLPLISPSSLPLAKASEAVAVLTGVVRHPSQPLSTSALRSLIKTMGCLLKLCDLNDWNTVQVPFETLMAFVVDKRPKVRKCAQSCIEELFKSLSCRGVLKRASKVLFYFFNGYMATAVQLSAVRAAEGSKSAILSKSEHVDVLHMLNLLKFIIPLLSEKVNYKLLLQLNKLLDSHFSPLTRHVFDILADLLKLTRAELIVPEVEEIIASLVSYVSFHEKNPPDTIVSAMKLLTCTMGKLHDVEPSRWIQVLPSVFVPLAGFLRRESEPARQAVVAMIQITTNLDETLLSASSDQLSDDRMKSTPQSTAMKEICAAIESNLDTSHGIPNEQTLTVVSHLFLKLGKFSYLFMKDILFILSKHVVVVDEDVPSMKHLQDCIGSAVIAMGPDKILTLIPVSLHAEKLTCSNFWLIPILKKFVVGASLKYFIDHIVPLAKSILKSCSKVNKKHLGQDLHACASGLWELLPAFCRYPSDTSLSFKDLCTILIAALKEDSYTHEAIAMGLQELVNANKEILRDSHASSHYTKKVASRNIKALASNSMSLLQPLTDVFLCSPSQKRAHLKEAISCLASITDSSKIKDLFISSLGRAHLMTEVIESDNPRCSSRETSEGRTSRNEQKESRRNLVVELACSLVTGADEDLTNTLFSYIKTSLEAADATHRSDAFCCLRRIFEEHPWFYSSRFDELMALLLQLKSDRDIMSLKSRLSCLQFLMVHLLESNSENSNEKAFLILNEIIFALKDVQPVLDMLLENHEGEALLLFSAPIHPSDKAESEIRILLQGIKLFLQHFSSQPLIVGDSAVVISWMQADLPPPWRILHSNKEAREAAYDTLLMVTSSLKGSVSANSDACLQQLFNMILGYLSGSSPYIMSGAVSALSLFIYKDPDLVFSLPDVMPSISVLLQSKAVEVVKAALGFMKVLVSCLQAKELQKLLNSVVNGVLPWSSVSKNHFRAKVRLIMEIVIRKCGLDLVESVTPEKYSCFIKKIEEQRHSNVGAKGTHTSVATTQIAHSSAEGPRKRKWERHADVEQNGSRFSAVQKEKRRKTLEGTSYREDKQSKPFDDGKNKSSWSKNSHRMGRQSGGQRVSTTGKPTGLKDRKMGRVKDTKRQTSKRPASDTKSPKNRRFGKKWG